MIGVLNIATHCNTFIQFAALVVIAAMLIIFAFLLYFTIRFIGFIILKFCKIDVDIDTISTHVHTKLRQ